MNQDIAALTDHKKDAVATHILTFMMHGIFTNREDTVAHFPTSGISGEHLYPIVWSVLKELECVGFKVACITCDGAAPNRKFFFKCIPMRVMKNME